MKQDAEICVARTSKTKGPVNNDLEEKAVTRSSRTEAASGANESGMSATMLRNAAEGSLFDSPTSGGSSRRESMSTGRRQSLVKQDVTLDYFRDRRPNKYSGMRKPITNQQNVFNMRWKTMSLLWLLGALTGTLHKIVGKAEEVSHMPCTLVCSRHINTHTRSKLSRTLPPPPPPHPLPPQYLFDLRRSLVDWASANFGYHGGWAFWSLFTVSMMMFSLLLTFNISPVAAGSGIPQMKTQLTGAKIKNYLSLKTLAAKLVGLTTAVGAGMFIGQEGPFVHISSAVANQVSKPVRTHTHAHSQLTSLPSSSSGSSRSTESKITSRCR